MQKFKNIFDTVSEYVYNIFDAVSEYFINGR